MPPKVGVAAAFGESYIHDRFVLVTAVANLEGKRDGWKFGGLEPWREAMIRFVQALEPRRLLSGAPSDPAVAAAVAKVEADVVQMHTDATFHNSIAATNAAFLTAKAADLTAIHADIASGNTQQLALDRQKFKSDVTAHTAGLKADVASWKRTHQTDVSTLHAGILALQQARKAAH